MKKLFNKKNPLFLLILSVLLLAGTMLFNAPSANAAVTDTVSMYFDDINYTYHGATTQNIYIKVANLSYTKDVSLHYTFTDYNGTWKTANAEYVESLDSNYDIFKATVSGFGSISYYINYNVNDTTYTDDNNGQFYTGEVLGSAEVHALRAYGTTTSYPIDVVTKGTGTDKSVKVVYTTDNWATSNEASLTPFSNSDGDNQFWYANLDLSYASSLAGFKYAVCCTVNGTEYWDNNFEANYDYTHYSEY